MSTSNEIGREDASDAVLDSTSNGGEVDVGLVGTTALASNAARCVKEERANEESGGHPVDRNFKRFGEWVAQTCN